MTARVPLSILCLALAACEGSGFSIIEPEDDIGSFRLDAGQSDGAIDTGVDGGGSNDATSTDLGFDDAGANDATPIDTGPADSGVVPCGFDNAGPADKPRIIALSHTFTAMPSVRGTDVRTLSLAMDGTITDDGVRLDVGFAVQRLEFVPSGQILLALGEDGELASIDVRSVTQLTVLDQVQLPSAGFGDLRLADDGQTIYVAGENVAETSGISTVLLDCAGELTVLDAQFYNVRLASSFVLVPGRDRAVLLGGQTVFDPIDPDDLRVLQYGATGFSEITPFDLWSDFVDAGRIAIAPNGGTVVVPNGSPFSSEGSQVSVLSLSGDVLSEVIRLQSFEDAREAMFSPDGSTVIISLLTPGQIAVVTDPGTGWALVDTIRGIGLADQLAGIRRGTLSGRVYVPSVDPNGGPNLASVEFGMPGVVSYVDQIELGPGSEQIPVAVAVMP